MTGSDAFALRLLQYFAELTGRTAPTAASPLAACAPSDADLGRLKDWVNTQLAATTAIPIQDTAASACAARGCSLTNIGNGERPQALRLLVVELE